MQQKKNCYNDFSYFDIENLEVLSSQIAKCTISEETFKKLFEYLFSMFDDCYNTDLIWDCIYKLGDKLPFDKWLEFVKKELSDSGGNKIRYIRLKHIKDIIDEKDFYIHVNDQMEEQEDVY